MDILFVLILSVLIFIFDRQIRVRRKIILMKNLTISNIRKERIVKW